MGHAYDLAARAFKHDGDFAFARSEVRHRQLKTRGDCGHLIDGSRHKQTPYRYHVWKVKGERGVRQRLECDRCMEA